jgi:hypothetical protein
MTTPGTPHLYFFSKSRFALFCVFTMPVMLVTGLISLLMLAVIFTGDNIGAVTSMIVFVIAAGLLAAAFFYFRFVIRFKNRIFAFGSIPVLEIDTANDTILDRRLGDEAVSFKDVKKYGNAASSSGLISLLLGTSLWIEIDGQRYTIDLRFINDAPTAYAQIFEEVKKHAAFTA